MLPWALRHRAGEARRNRLVNARQGRGHETDAAGSGGRHSRRLGNPAQGADRDASAPPQWPEHLVHVHNFQASRFRPSSRLRHMPPAEPEFQREAHAHVERNRADAAGPNDRLLESGSRRRWRRRPRKQIWVMGGVRASPDRVERRPTQRLVRQRQKNSIGAARRRYISFYAG